MDKEFQNLFDKAITQYAIRNQYDISPIPDHKHTGVDSPKINPADLMGFPVIQVANATIAPTDIPQNGVFRFYVDTTPRYRLWAYLIYNNIGAWKVISLT